MSKIIKRLIAIAGLLTIYSLGIILNTLLRAFSKKDLSGKIIINGTFHNPNWIKAHLEPITIANPHQTILICDENIDILENVTIVTPNRTISKLCSRAGAKFLYTLRTALKHPGSLLIGYHIFPSSITALICARLSLGHAIYQVTGGPLELEGGGWNAENPLLRMLNTPSRMVQYIAIKCASCFDLIVVRGTGARRYLEEHGVKTPITILTGSVDTQNLRNNNREIDLLLVGRLVETKRFDIALHMIAEIAKDHKNLKTIFVGDGPLRAELESLASSLGISSCTEFWGQRSDVIDIMKRSKVFLLTSRSEGVSIAMLEAMSCGVVPVVTNVGDLADFAIQGKNGYLFEPDDTEPAVETIKTLLLDNKLRNEYAMNAKNLVETKSSKLAITEFWNTYLARRQRR